MEIKVVPARDLYDLDGDAVPVREVRIDQPDDGTVIGLWTVSWETWTTIDERRLFHLDPNLRGPIFGGSLDEGRDVEIEARLDDEVAAAVRDEDVFVTGAKLRGAGADDAIARTESWFALRVKQDDPDIPGLKTGFQTSWAD